MVQLQSGQGQGEPREPHQNRSDSQPPRSPPSLSLTLLSAKRNQKSEGKTKSSAEEEIPNQLNHHSSGACESYRAETPRRLVQEFLSLTLRCQHISLTPAAMDDHALGAPHDPKMRVSQTSCKQASQQLLYQSASNIVETREPIQYVTPKHALRDMKMKFAKLKKEKELAV